MRLYTKLHNIELYELDGVDLMGLIGLNKSISLDDYVWLNGTSRGAINGGLVKNLGKLFLIYTKILQLDLRRPRNDDHRKYINIPVSKFLQYIPNKNDISIIKRLLEGSGVIDINRISSKGGKGYKAFAQGYRINPKYLGSKRVRLYRKDNPKQEEYFFLKKAYDNWGKPPTKIESNVGSGESPDNEAIVDIDTSVIKWLKLCHFNVDIDMDLVERTLGEHLVHPDPDKRITQLEYSKAFDRADTISRFRTKYPTKPNFTKSKAVGRVSCNVNRLNKILRPALSYMNHKIYWVDVHACQPFLLQLLYDDIPSSIDVVRERKEYNLLWKKDTKNFYLNFSKLSDNVKGIKEVKGLFLGKRGLLSRYQDKRKNYVSRIMCDNFPILDKHIKIIKTTPYLPKRDEFWIGYEDRLKLKRRERLGKNKKDKRKIKLPTELYYQQLAYILQRLEAKTVIDTACNNFMQEFGKESFALTIHDGVGVQASRRWDIKRHLREAFIQVTGNRCRLA